jgi:hypothetical protein
MPHPRSGQGVRSCEKLRQSTGRLDFGGEPLEIGNVGFVGPELDIRDRGGTREERSRMIKYVYSIDYPLGKKREYVDWVRSIADTLQKPDELKRLASYDNVFSASPQRVVEFSFESLADAATYFERPEMTRIFASELPQHGANVGITVLKRLTDYSKDDSGGE